MFATRSKLGIGAALQKGEICRLWGEPLLGGLSTRGPGVKRSQPPSADSHKQGLM